MASNKFVTARIAYLIGVASEVCESYYGDNYDEKMFATYAWAAQIRACSRARQVTMFHMTNGPKIFRLPDSVRSYCPPDYFDELQKKFLDFSESAKFVNAMGGIIDEHIVEVLTDMGIECPNAVANIVFKWPPVNKQSLTVMSKNYRKKNKYHFPFEAYVPKPSSFNGGQLSRLLNTDNDFWNAAPLKVARSLDTSSHTNRNVTNESVELRVGSGIKLNNQITTEKEPYHTPPKPARFNVVPPNSSIGNSAPAKVPSSIGRASADYLLRKSGTSYQQLTIHTEQIFKYGTAKYVKESFDPEALPFTAGNVISYVDFDNIPESLVVQICNQSSVARRVKIFYDDRTHGRIEMFENFPFVEPKFIDRMNASKSLVDAGILIEMMKDLYTQKITSAILYSSDSDFYPIAMPFMEKKVPLTVVTTEKSVSDAYAKSMATVASDVYVLSDFAVTPKVSKVFVRQVLSVQLGKIPLSKFSVKEMEKKVLDAMAATEYHALLGKDVSSMIEDLMKDAKIEMMGDSVRVVFPES